jgi:hypothetical protein
VAALGHQHGHLGFQRAGDADHLVGGGHFQVELDVGEFAQAAHVVVLDVAAVFAQMHGDAVGAAEVGFDGGPDRVGFVALAGFAHGGDVVDVYAEFDHLDLPPMPSLKLLQFHEHAARLQALAAKVMRDQLTHQAPAFEPRARVGIVVGGHVEQGLAGQGRGISSLAVPSAPTLACHRAAFDQKGIAGLGHDRAAGFDVDVQGQAIAKFLEQGLLEAAQFGRIGRPFGQACSAAA